ncbi:hypothetical protein ZWY2020_013258 [Hordeum vulgare]|nr:hypothetical protein ZWY2020_013258 [Hordeum vulgare]
MSAWRLRPIMLVLFLFLFSVMPHSAFSGRLAMVPPAPVAPNTCNSIEYPFGVKGKAQQPGFEVTCGRNNEAMLQIDKHSYKIDYVSVEEGFVVIFAGPIHQVCYDRNGKQMKATGIGNISLEQTPFSFSSRNNLVVTGCNYMLVGKFSNSSAGHNTSHAGKPTICYTYCDESSDTVDCLHSVACCKASMPMNTAREFTFKFEKIEEQDMGEEDGTCSAAFFLAQGEDDVFMATKGGVGRPLPLKDMLLPAGDHRMILDWTVGRGTCSQASTHNLSRRYCNNMSRCIDAPTGAGHLCKCHAGYDGNPYTADGCVDIDECRTSSSNNCTFQNYCLNTDGGFTCSCPHNWTGDGYKKGTECKEALSSSGSPMQQPQGLNVCTQPEKNPCVYLATCSSDGEGAACDCPQGMRGDGRKKGKGCQKHFPLDTALGVGLALVVTISSAALCCYWGMKRRKTRRKKAELFRRNGGLLLQQRFTAITSQGSLSVEFFFSANKCHIVDWSKERYQLLESLTEALK